MRKNYDILDLTKFILSFFIVALHSNVLPDVMIPIYRTAVPLFFIISRYLFFGKQATLNDSHAKQSVLFKFVKRNLLLYLFWFIVLLPITLKVRQYFVPSVSIGRSIFNILRNFVLGSTFCASWFIMAGVIGTFLIFYLSKVLGNKILLILSVLIYIACCGFSSYCNILSDFGLNSAMDSFSTILHPYNSFPVALVWICIGKCVAESNRSHSKKWVLPSLALSLGLLYAEFLLITKHYKISHNDCFIMLIPVCTLTFLALKDIQISLKYAKTFRKLSTLVYTMHDSFIQCLYWWVVPLLNLNPVQRTYFIFFVVLAICLLFSAIILWLEKFKPFKFLKYAH